MIITSQITVHRRPLAERYRADALFPFRHLGFSVYTHIYYMTGAS